MTSYILVLSEALLPPFVGKSCLVRAGAQNCQATEFCTVVHNICGSSVCTVLRVTNLGPGFSI